MPFGTLWFLLISVIDVLSSCMVCIGSLLIDFGTPWGGKTLGMTSWYCKDLQQTAESWFPKKASHFLRLTRALRRNRIRIAIYHWGVSKHVRRGAQKSTSGIAFWICYMCVTTCSPQRAGMQHAPRNAQSASRPQQASKLMKIGNHRNRLNNLSSLYILLMFYILWTYKFNKVHLNKTRRSTYAVLMLRLKSTWSPLIDLIPPIYNIAKPVRLKEPQTSSDTDTSPLRSDYIATLLSSRGSRTQAFGSHGGAAGTGCSNRVGVATPVGAWPWGGGGSAQSGGPVETSQNSAFREDLGVKRTRCESSLARPASTGAVARGCAGSGL